MSLTTANPILFGTVFASVALFPLQQSAQADAARTHVRKMDHSKPAEALDAYRLVLSLPTDAGYRQPGVPYVTLNLINPTKRTLILRWVPPYDVVFKVDYKAPATDPSLDTGWEQLKSNAPPPPENSQWDPHVIAEEHVEKVEVLPGKEQDFLFPLPFTMANQGFYRINANMTVPIACDFDPAAGSRAKTRIFRLVVRSKPFVIRRTSDAFVAAGAVSDK